MVTAEEPVVVGFEEFYRAELDRQVRRCYLLTGSAEVANDIVHDAMLDVYRRWSSLDRPGAYLNTSVVNRCRDRARRDKVCVRVAPLIATNETWWDRSVADGVALDRALAGLPFNQRAALILRFFADMTADEIASALGCRSGSVGPWIHRGLASLEKELS
jgi:RNA polymerase sigma-70 factor (ECF subfamily)